ncbi:MAG: sulfite exporter TauE/SafE family protein, partial [Candidatus Woesebacteria bacterium]|nr:sulfite exporter TauE/SafE family protein [Candidatus Woesebacteria bacterium]
VNASLAEKTITVYSKRGITQSLNEYNKSLDTHGYTLHNEPIGKVVWNQQTIINGVLVLLILSIIYLFLKLQGSLTFFTVNQSSSFIAFFIFGLIAGISSCAALVGGLLLSLSKQWNSLYGGTSIVKKSTPFIMFNIGRLVSYAILGGILGLIGSVFKINIFSTSIIILFVSILMIIIGLQTLGVSFVSKIRLRLPSNITRRLSTVENFQGKYMPFLTGALTFFLPCGFTLLVQTIALASGSFITSSIIMFMFALGTLPSLGLISFSSIKFQSSQSYSSVFNLVVGVLIIFFGLYNINSQFLVIGLPNISTITSKKTISNFSNIQRDFNGLGSEVIDKNGKQVQKVYMKAERFEYLPKTLTLKSGIPTELNIENNGVIGCAQAMYLRGLFDNIVYLNKKKISINFIPKKGTYYITCSMGMVQPVTVNVL